MIKSTTSKNIKNNTLFAIANIITNNNITSLIDALLTKINNRLKNIFDVKNASLYFEIRFEYR